MKLASPKLSPRMKAFIEHAIKDAPLWDVCCDHGYVGIKALTSNQFTNVHFVDQLPHIMKRLQQLIFQDINLRAHHIYELHTCAGEDIEHVVEGNLLVAGVGGYTIKKILSSLLEHDRLKAKRLLLSPQTDEQVFIDYVMQESFQKKYKIVEKILLPEKKKLIPFYIIDLVE